MKDARLRDAKAADFDAIPALNEASVSLLSPLSPQRLAELHAQAALHRVVERDGDKIRFLLAFREGADYDSPNYRWFAERYPLLIARVMLAFLALVFASPGEVAAATWQQRPDWAQFFQRAGVGGTIVVVDQRAGADARLMYGAERARTRFIPASTFKIPHALFALDAGIVRDEFQAFRWDGTKRDVESWNRDQDLRSSMRNSTVWVFQQFARELGEERERTYLGMAGYGNADPSGGIDTFWLGGNLRISAEEQVAFLQRLYRNTLPFRVEHQRLVKDVMIVEAGRTWILRAKTGWAARVNPQVGWWVGWVEWPDGPVFFAINIEMPNGAEDLAKREGVAREVLRSIGALPAESSPRER